MAELIRLEGLSKRYIATQALDHVDLSIAAGEVLCIAGTNGSGKSTLMKCICGAEEPDSGNIVFDGHAYKRLSPSQAMRLGIQIIYQDLAIFPDLTVAENIAFHEIQHRKGLWVDWKACRKTAEDALASLGAKLPLDARLGDLSFGAKQTTAIARALTQECRLLIMDEPTSALPARDVEQLLTMVRRLKERGISVIFVSHKLDEVFEIADRIYVLRDGKEVGEYAPADINVSELGFLMTGVRVVAGKSDEVRADAPVLLEVQDLQRDGQYRDLSFALRAGEVLGFAGLTGSGRTETALSLFGLNPAKSGRVLVDGAELRITSPQDAVRAGIVLVSEDRASQGLFGRKPIRMNIASSIYERIKGALSLISSDKEATIGDEWVTKVRVKTPSAAEPVQSLSGGNQQKVVLAKWLATEPKILILDNPTAGIDVGSKAEIHEIVQTLAREGCGVIMISDDLDELAMSCNRVLVFRTGRIVEEFSGPEITSARIAATIRQDD
ncbi:sugar ABC transporter ATP-binding protein [Afifella sp. JA880]|uniref:sugar ABC transporter ATP-binding protein n=1 Tax=Afifella sp. JA880 TaxID=2975280 RepID=UPI0021BBA22A|nr:sugar ABC transporter ATP-binding protein [Afifella sp. JA880]MCT8265688.1 sugar ABC transporter ATP-binding protein [Afifella sp. JA880]